MSDTSTYAEWSPPGPLRAAVACLWRRTAPDGAPGPALVLPDGCVDLIWESDRGAFLAGPDTGPMPTVLPPGRMLLGVRFRPGAGGPVLGLPLGSVRNLRIDARDWRPALAGQLAGALSPAEALQRLTALAGRFVTERPPDRGMVAAARLLADPATRVGEVGTVLGVSDRQLRRRFTAAVGYGPKTLHRVLRFRRFVDGLTSGVPAGLAELALRVGYADQAHLSRETTDLAGMPPTALARALNVAGVATLHRGAAQVGSARGGVPR